MKNTFVIMVILMNVIFIDSINAMEIKEGKYINDYGVVFTKEEYDFISKFYFEGYQDFMTRDSYMEFVNSSLMNADINIQVLEENNFGNTKSVHETTYKILKLATACVSDSCHINTTLSWKKSPSIRSYDLIGAYLKNTSLINTVNSRLYYGDVTMLPTETYENSKGISATFDLPNTSELIRITQSFSIIKLGSVNVSYQHAQKNISLANSRKYSFSSNGLGGVFSFETSIESYYDAMKGLSANFA